MRGPDSRYWRSRRPCRAPTPRSADTTSASGTEPLTRRSPWMSTTTPSADTSSRRSGDPNSAAVSGWASSSMAAVSFPSTACATRWLCSWSPSDRSTSRRDRVEPRNSAAARVPYGGRWGPAVVVAGDEPPQPPVPQQGDRHRRPHAHVLQVLDVDRRDAAQRGVGEVQGGAARRVDVGYQRCGRVVDVRDQADPVLLVQRPRLGRNVGGRVVQAQERVEVLALGLGDDLTVVFLVVAVHHDPVEER